ncbi:MAG: hypothetical protein QXP91_05885 [Candidatus Methanomethylicia archaeon]
MKYLNRYARRLLKNMLKLNIERHNGRRWRINIDNNKGIIEVFDEKSKRKNILLL